MVVCGRSFLDRMNRMERKGVGTCFGKKIPPRKAAERTSGHHEDTKAGRSSDFSVHGVLVPSWFAESAVRELTG